MTTDTKTLRTLALAQMPNESRGKWFARETYVYQSSDPRDRRQVCRVPTVSRAFEVDPTAAFIAAASPQTVVGLLDEIERLREFAVTPMQRAADLDQAVAEETAALREQLTAMTAARNEACDLADYWRHAALPALAQADKHAARIAELRKVGEK
jgi:hypothetical protein